MPEPILRQRHSGPARTGNLVAIDEITVTACRAAREVQPVAVDEITVTASEFYLAHVLFEEATKAFPETKFFRRSLPRRQTVWTVVNT
jgi:hypothetical protein